MKIPLHVQIRKNLRSSLYYLLSKFIKTKESRNLINKNEMKHIILIRPNYRIGNLIFLTPLINELAKEIPDAQIDVIVGMKLAGKILEPLPNINKVIDIPRELLLHPIDLYKFIKETRDIKYDLAINISEGSFSSQIVTAIINSKYKTSFKSDKNFISLTHVVTKESLYLHSGSRPLEFLKLFTDKLPKQDLELDIKLTQDEINFAINELNNLCIASGVNKENRTIALFRNARFDKKIADKWWNEWHQELQKLDNKITVIDILSPDILTKLNENCLEYSNKNLRLLGAFFKACNMYVSADTGPLHLSAASQAKTVALFNKTHAKIYGTIGENNKTIDINNLTPKTVAKLCYEQLQN